MGVGWGVNVLSTTSLILRCQHICSLEDATCYCNDTTLRWGGGGGGVGWGCQRPVDTSLILRWDATCCNQRCQHICSCGVGVGWGGAVNVLSTTSLILRCQHICSLEDATCYCVDTTLRWGGVGVGWGGAVNVLLTTSLIYYVVSIYVLLRMQHATALTLR